jgi:hypothetical protein
VTLSTTFSIIGLALVSVFAIVAVAVAVSIALWRVGSLAPIYRCGLIAAISLIALASIGWIVFVVPAYMD